MPRTFKVGNVVWHGDPPILYIVTAIEGDAKTASIKSTPTPLAFVVHHNVKWPELTLLDESQNDARIV